MDTRKDSIFEKIDNFMLQFAEGMIKLLLGVILPLGLIGSMFAVIPIGFILTNSFLFGIPLSFILVGIVIYLMRALNFINEKIEAGEKYEEIQMMDKKKRIELLRRMYLID